MCNVVKVFGEIFVCFETLLCQMVNFVSMKYITICLVILSLGLCRIEAQSLNFRPISLDDAIQAAAIENKPVLLMAYQSTCGHCEKMLNEVFIDTALIRFYNANYICIKEDLLDQTKAKLYIKRFYITSFPTFIILDKNAELLYQYVGEFTAEEFIHQGTVALDHNNQIPTVKSAFEKNRRDSTACYNYLLVLSRGRLQTQTTANVYFNAWDKNPEITESNWKIFSMSVSDMGSEVFNFMIKNRAAFGAIVTDKKVDRKIYLTAAYNLQSPANANDTVVYFRNRNLAEQLHLDVVDSLIFINDLSVYEKNKQWDNYMRVALNGTEKFVWDDANALRRIGDVFIKNCTDVNTFKKITSYGVRCAELKPEYYNYLVAANLFLKAEDKTNAKDYATRAKKMGEKINMNISEANLVLSQCEGG